MAVVSEARDGDAAPEPGARWKFGGERSRRTEDGVREWGPADAAAVVVAVARAAVRSGVVPVSLDWAGRRRVDEQRGL